MVCCGLFFLSLTPRQTLLKSKFVLLLLMIIPLVVSLYHLPVRFNLHTVVNY
jgi:hypothetical protein